MISAVIAAATKTRCLQWCLPTLNARAAYRIPRLQPFRRSSDLRSLNQTPRNRRLHQGTRRLPSVCPSR